MCVAEVLIDKIQMNNFIMEVIGTSKCQKHGEEVNFMCSRYSCFVDRNMLICKLCFGEHKEHHKDIIELSLLEAGVKVLMGKRMEYEMDYEKACDKMIHEFKVFKAYKDEVTNRLNRRERDLNEFCKKIKKHISYEKDESFFKKHFGHIYLATRGLNQNIDLYKKFKKELTDEIKEMAFSLRRLECSLLEENHLLLEKDHQVCAILRKHQDYKIIQEPQYFESQGAKFKKETFTFKAKEEQSPHLFRMGEQDFLTYNNKHELVRWYNTKTVMFPRVFPFKSPIDNLTMMGRHAFCSTLNGGMKIFDMLSEGIVKEYSSSNQKSARIIDLLAVSSNSVLSYITNPNQIIHFRFDEEKQTLGTVGGIQTKNRALKNILIEDRFFSSFDDLKLRGYNLQTFEQQLVYKFQNPLRAMCKVNEMTLMLGGDNNQLNLLDLRIKRVINCMKVKGPCSNVEKLTNNHFIYTCGSSVRTFDSRNLKNIFEAEIEDDFKNLKVLNSSLFVSSSLALHVWRMVD